MAKKKPKIKGPDILDMMGNLQRQLATLEQKLDMFFVRTAEKIVHPHHAPHGQPQGQPQAPKPPQGQPQRQRVMFQAVCADCRKNCEVPFKPSGDRPVYCKECFAKRRSGGHQHRPAPQPPQPPPQPAVEKKAPAKKKKAPAKKTPKKAAKKKTTAQKKKRQ